MNYFSMHIGDWATATAHLTPIEEAAYHRLLHYYYHTESALPDDAVMLARKLRMSEHQDVISLILSEFFVLDNGVWRQKRCDEEITAYQRKVQSAKRAAESRYKKPQLKQNTAEVLSETQCASDANQEPITNNQEPSKEKQTKRKPKPRQTSLPKDFIWNETRQASAINYWNKHGRGDLSAKAEQIFENFLNHCIAKASVYADWDAAWRTWYSKAPQFERRPANATYQQPFESPSERSDRALAQYLERNCA